MRRLACVLILALTPHATAAACRQVKAETDIVGIRIGDEASSRRVLGDPRSLPQEQDKDAKGTDLDFPYVRVISADGRQQAKLYAHYGDIVGSYNEIEVRPAPGGGTGKRVPFAELATERGIKLGMREAELTRTLGSCFRREGGKGGESIIVYAIDDPDHALLRRAKMPSYFARYAFKDGRLAWFRLGFEYP
jgi:hypothetical protein